MTEAVPTRRNTEAQVTRQLRKIFSRLPALAGFQLRSDLMVADVSVVSGSPCTSIRRLHVSVMQALVELAECDPEAMVLMRGRTFVRCPQRGEQHVEMCLSNRPAATADGPAPPLHRR